QPRDARARAGRAGAAAHGRQPDEGGGAARSQSRSDPVPHREVRPRQARPGGPLTRRSPARTMNVGVLASHEGTTLQTLLDACSDGRIQGRVAVVVSNNSDSGALRRARQAGVRALHLSSKTHEDPAALDAAIRDALVAADVDVVFLAGYMKKLGPLVLRAFERRILNTHPALLPRFGGPGMYGDRVFEAVLAAGETE